MRSLQASLPHFEYETGVPKREGGRSGNETKSTDCEQLSAR